VGIIQIRERDLEAGRLVDLCRRIAVRARGSATQVLVNERADVALVSGADGVHLRSTSFAVSRARTLESSWIVGRSCHDASEIAAASGGDYALFGTVFPSASKPTPVAEAAGLPALRRTVRAAGRLPVIAIGGIDTTNARRCFEAGAAGVAGIAVFLPRGAAPASLGVAQAVSLLREAAGNGPVPTC
jgi:thiamine-phosphate pyrophosphorylase